MLGAASATTATATTAIAEPLAGFHTGPVFTQFGQVASVDADFPIPPGTEFKVLFNVTDGADGADKGKINQDVESAARFINMQVAAGVPIDRIHLAIVAHGPAILDLLGPKAYAARFKGRKNPSRAMVEQLLAKSVQIVVCGQTSAAQKVAHADLLPGVKTALSAMTASTLFQQQGYTLNP
ncbi:MAG: DsrE family protein [Sphingomonas sp.]|nr:DsrE family protein [Sphingomonas sp.]